MGILSQPSEELAKRLVSEVEWSDRIMGHSLKSSGTSSYSFLSLEQIAGFLGHSSMEATHADLMLPGGSFTICYVKPEALQEWVETVVQDAALAAAMRESFDATAAREAEGAVVPYPHLMAPIKQLLDERVAQAKAVLGIVEEPVSEESGAATADA